MEWAKVVARGAQANLRSDTEQAAEGIGEGFGDIFLLFDVVVGTAASRREFLQCTQGLVTRCLDRVSQCHYVLPHQACKSLESPRCHISG
jgi:hypothetical protein